MSTFLKTNTGVPQLPIGGGYSTPQQMPLMRAPIPQVAPAGEGPIAGFSMGVRAGLTSAPPMGGRAISGLPAIVEGNLMHGVWPY